MREKIPTRHTQGEADIVGVREGVRGRGRELWRNKTRAEETKEERQDSNGGRGGAGAGGGKVEEQIKNGEAGRVSDRRTRDGGGDRVVSLTLI